MFTVAYILGYLFSKNVSYRTGFDDMVERRVQKQYGSPRYVGGGISYGGGGLLYNEETDELESGVGYSEKEVAKGRRWIIARGLMKSMIVDGVIVHAALYVWLCSVHGMDATNGFYQDVIKSKFNKERTHDLQQERFDAGQKTMIEFGGKTR